MKELTKKQRYEIYKRGYELHLIDIRFSKRENKELFGMCHNLRNALSILGYDGYSVRHLPEFIALKPNNKHFLKFWWSRNNTNITRKKKYKQIIKQTKS